MESKAVEASGKSAEQRRAERKQKAVIGEKRHLQIQDVLYYLWIWFFYC